MPLPKLKPAMLANEAFTPKGKYLVAELLAAFTLPSGPVLPAGTRMVVRTGGLQIAAGNAHACAYAPKGAKLATGWQDHYFQVPMAAYKPLGRVNLK